MNPGTGCLNFGLHVTPEKEAASAAIFRTFYEISDKTESKDLFKDLTSVCGKFLKRFCICFTCRKPLFLVRFTTSLTDFAYRGNLTAFSEVMTSAQRLLRSQRELLLNWTCDHPAPLLRWLHDAEVISSTCYLSLLEKSPSTAVAQALETACASEESSQKFLSVPKEVQDYYCSDLHLWVNKHCRSEIISKPSPEPVEVGGDISLKMPTAVL